MTEQQQLHVVFGAGQVGSLLVQEILTRGHRVRVVRRSAQQATHPDMECVAADVYDGDATVRAAAGADVVYLCVNAPYHEWPTKLPPLYRHIAAAALATKARLVVLDNVYMVGANGTFDETTPEQPRSRKGQIRKDLADELGAMHARGDLSVVFGRASDFFGPGVSQGAIQHPRAMGQLLASKTMDLLGDADQPHSWSYVPDVARALAELGAHPELAGRVWHLPVAPAQTARAQLGALAAQLGVPLKLRTMPRWMLKAAGLFSPMMAEMDEMLYQFNAPFILDDARIRAELSLQPTPLAEQVVETAAWLRRASRPA